jgi:hypothetical protein
MLPQTVALVTGETLGIAKKRRSGGVTFTTNLMV